VAQSLQQTFATPLIWLFGIGAVLLLGGFVAVLMDQVTVLELTWRSDIRTLRTAGPQKGFQVQGQFQPFVAPR
jgi:hypothetical protein